jgi:hypothetical protein
MTVYSIFNLVQPHFRRRRMRQFIKALSPTPETRILDVGGYAHFWIGSGVKSEITVVNIHHVKATPNPDLRITTMQGDGCHLPFKDESFDIVFSNSVIEHLSTFARQQEFAREAQRVGRQLWIQTPARSFPIEPHLLTPLIHFLPKATQRRVLRNFTTWGLLSKPSPEQVDAFLAEVRLLDRKEMIDLFPDCSIIDERFLGMAKSYVAVRKQA